MQIRKQKYAPYPELLRRSLVARLLASGGPTVHRLSREVGISEQSLYNWVKRYGNSAPMSEPKNRTPDSWSASEKFKAIIETSKMDDSALGKYLRKNGLHTSDLNKWRDELESQLESEGSMSGNSESAKALRKENKGLKREIRRKDKALAEVSALLILKKKAAILFGEIEGDEQD